MADVFQGIDRAQAGVGDPVLRLVAVAEAQGAEEEAGAQQQLGRGQPERDLLAEGPDLRVVDRGPGGVVAGGHILDPVDQVVAAVVVGGGEGADAAAGVLDAGFDGPQLLGLQVRIRPVAADRIVELREGRHPVGRVIGGVEAQGFGEAEIGVDAGEQADAFPVAGVVDRREAGRGGEAPEREPVFQEEVVGRTGEAADVDAARLCERLAQVRAGDPLVARLGAEGGLPEAGIDPEVQVQARDMGLVVVERILFRGGPEELEAVLAVVPVEGRGEMERAGALRADGGEGLQGVLELVVEGGAVESAGAEILAADAGLPGEVAAGEGVAAVPEGLQGVEVAVAAAGGVAGVAVAALPAGGDGVEAAAVGGRHRGGRAERAEGAALEAGGDPAPGGPAGHDIDGAKQGGGPVDARCRAFQDLNALDVAEVDGEVKGVVAGLRVGDVDAVEEDGDLVVGAAADADVGLHAHRAPLAHIDAEGVFEQVVDRLRRRRGDRHAVQQRHDPRAAVERHRHPARRHPHAVQRHRPFLRPARQPGCHPERQHQHPDYE